MKTSLLVCTSVGGERFSEQIGAAAFGWELLRCRCSSEETATTCNLWYLLGTEACMLRKLLQDDDTDGAVPWVMKAIDGEQWRGGA
jgi:hypothetical protein